MSTDEERLADLLVESLSSGAYNATAKTVAARLLNKGVTLPPAPDPPCVSKASAVIAAALGTKAADWSPEARALHAAGLCSCAADALLRRWLLTPGLDGYAGTVDATQAYLEGR